ncbi:calcium uniporter protein, mitochondrial [Salvelinus sp. IW2-2015]|uniref:calcium uniporter protein, mitochondrial n=1 Tax=Salvelinus sp. IW2-2015 TaxID=2691554 RepID=UPI0038D3B56C
MGKWEASDGRTGGGYRPSAIYSTDGARVASSTGIDILLLDDFNLVINDVTHLVRPPRRELLANDEAERLNDVKFLVQQLYTTMRIEEHQLSKEKELVVRLEDLNSQLRPLEKVREELSRKAERRTTWVLWGGMAYMATQFGILARLTWWEYSWDIMEPVTYFITYATAMAMYSYYVLTRQEYLYPDARDRQYLLFFHKGVKRQRFDIYKYNELKDSIAEVGTNPNPDTNPDTNPNTNPDTNPNYTLPRHPTPTTTLTRHHPDTKPRH